MALLRDFHTYTRARSRSHHTDTRDYPGVITLTRLRARGMAVVRIVLVAVAQLTSLGK